MKSRILPLFALVLAASGCAGAKLKEQQERIAQLQVDAGALQEQVSARDARLSALEAEKGELSSKLSDASERLKASQARIDSLVKSNQDLSKSLEANKGELGGKLKEVVREKDELSRRLAELQKQKISDDRAREVLQTQKAKLQKEVAALRLQLEALERRLSNIAAEEQRRAQELSNRRARAQEEMGALADSMLKELQSERARIAVSGENIEISIEEPLLFEPQQAKLLEGGTALLDRLGSALHALGARTIRVEGHCDNSPLKAGLFGGFTSLWELSAARATAVARYLHEHAGLDPKRISASGFGEFRPLRANDSQAGRQANRRVVMIVEPAS